jgi:hypothetical protein
MHAARAQRALLRHFGTRPAQRQQHFADRDRALATGVTTNSYSERNMQPVPQISANEANS